MISAIITGAIGITVANPTDVVKVRLQNQRKAAISGSSVKNSNLVYYNGTWDCYKKTVQMEGIKGLWTSWSANCVRNSVINCAELASYDQYKQMILESGLMADGTPCYLTCAFGAGFTACIFGSPLDVLTTRHMNSPGKYKNPVDVILTTVREEGVTALYKGFTPNVVRLGAFNMVL
jgi:solute carrier family 25 uncoupling protein 8/9